MQLLARRHGVTLRAEKGVSARVAVASLAGRRVALSVPTTYINDSGTAVRDFVKRFSIEDPGALLVVHDELDLPPGTVRIKSGGGLAGHNGLRSISSHLHTNDFLRVRIGVGKPPSAAQGASRSASATEGRARAAGRLAGDGSRLDRAHRARRHRRSHAVVPFAAVARSLPGIDAAKVPSTTSDLSRR